MAKHVRTYTAHSIIETPRQISLPTLLTAALSTTQTLNVRGNLVKTWPNVGINGSLEWGHHP